MTQSAVGMFVWAVVLLTYQKTLKLLGLSDVNPAVFFNDFDVFHFIIESVKPSKPNQMFCCILRSLVDQNEVILIGLNFVLDRIFATVLET